MTPETKQLVDEAIVQACAQLSATAAECVRVLDKKECLRDELRTRGKRSVSLDENTQMDVPVHVLMHELNGQLKRATDTADMVPHKLQVELERIVRGLPLPTPIVAPPLDDRMSPPSEDSE